MNFRFHKEVIIPVNGIHLQGELIVPLKAESIIIFSHGSGSSRLSPRNQMVAGYLQERNFGTLLFDLLTVSEDKHYYNRFDIGLLTKRLIGATEWLEQNTAAQGCLLGYFGASTGAASALMAAEHLPQVRAIVSRGGRPDLAMDILSRIGAPTLFIVGSLDFDVLQLNRQAWLRLKGEKQLEIVEGASHLFEEPGTMDKVCKLASDWFEKYLLPVKV